MRTPKAVPDPVFQRSVRPGDTVLDPGPSFGEVLPHISGRPWVMGQQTWFVARKPLA